MGEGGSTSWSTRHGSHPSLLPSLHFFIRSQVLRTLLLLRLLSFWRGLTTGSGCGKMLALVRPRRRRQGGREGGREGEMAKE